MHVEQHRQNVRIIIFSGWSTTRLATSKLKHVTLWKDHITANRQNAQNCLSARLGVRPEHLWSSGLAVPTHHISLLSATSLQAHSEASHTPSASSSPRPRGVGWESIWASLLSVSCFICFFVLKKRRKNLSWMSCIETLALKLLQCSHSAPSIPTQWPFVPRAVTWQELWLRCHRQLLRAQRDQDLQPQVMDSIHDHRVPSAPWSLGPGNVTFGTRLPPPAHHLHYTGRTKSKPLTIFLHTVRANHLNFSQFVLSLASYGFAKALWNHWQKKIDPFYLLWHTNHS